jgi:hypothetical protein
MGGEIELFLGIEELLTGERKKKNYEIYFTAARCCLFHSVNKLDPPRRRLRAILVIMTNHQVEYA